MRPSQQRPEPSIREAAAARRLRLRAARLVTDMFAGEYRSAFRGRGIEFEEVREYQPGDDIRAIDWNVTARAGRPFVKRFVEEREMTAIILLDGSPSLDAATPGKAKNEVAAEVCALLAFAAVRSNDRVGLVVFTDRIERHVPPGKGLRHAQRLLAELRQPPAGRGTDLSGALAYLEKLQRRPCILFIVSDFVAADYRLPLIAAARRHDVVAVSVAGPFDDTLPRAGLLDAVDPETGARRLVDTGNARVRAAFQERARAARFARHRLFAEAGVEHLRIRVDASPAQALARFFSDRSSRRRR